MEKSDPKWLSYYAMLYLTKKTTFSISDFKFTKQRIAFVRAVT